MTREEYQKEYLESFIREEYDSMVWGDNLFTDHVRKMFNAGIQCADTMPKPGLVDLSKVWHDASEAPQHDALILFQSIYGDILLIRFADRKSSMTTIRRWVYVDDLLPKEVRYEKDHV